MFLNKTHRRNTMALKHAPFCARCGQHRTLHASGLCSYCRRRPNPRTLCNVCGNLTTNHESGSCYKCRKVSALYANKLDQVLAYYQRIVKVLELRSRGNSFSSIASEIGMSKGATYGIYCRALDLPDWSKPTDV